MVDDIRRRALAKRSRWVLKSAIGQLEGWPELRALYKEQIIKPRRELARQIIRRGVEEGELRDDIELELLTEMLIGPILVRAVLWDESPLDDDGLAEQMVDAVLTGAGVRPPAEVPPSGGESH
ncbi:TetR-like C-terminal domain-containing protein [Kitasatospora gansuensis]